MGHARQLSEIRARLGPDTALVSVMSGNFVQRGDFAVFSKQARAEAALACGLDLVLELPLPFCLSSAEGFAAGAVALLHSLGCVSHLAFGCEDPALSILQLLAQAARSPEADAGTGRQLRAGLSYAAARQAALAQLLGEETASLLKKANNILAVEYLKALSALGASMQPLPLPRFGAGHDAAEESGYSASALRRRLYAGASLESLVPPAALSVYRREMAAGRGPVSARNSERAILARLRGLSDAEWQALPGNAEGLSDRLARAARSCTSLTALLEQCRTKRYALSRIRRMLLCAYLGLEQGDFPRTPAYVRVLAFNDRGRDLLRRAGTCCPLPMITKPAAGKGLASFCRDTRATDLYVLAYPDLCQARGGTEFLQSPVFQTADKG